MTFNTGNPVGSTDARDLYDNAQNFDKLSIGPDPSYPDRLGVPRKSWAGMEADFAAFLAASGFEPDVLQYVDGSPLTVFRPTQLIQRASSPDALYAVKLPAVFPVSLSGAWGSDESKLIVRVDQTLRQELASGSGSEIVMYGGRSVSNRLSDRKSLADNSPSGDGVADDLAAVNAAIAGSPDGKVLLGPAIYRVSAAPANPYGVEFDGKGVLGLPVSGGLRQLNTYADKHKIAIGKEYLFRAYQRLALGQSSSTGTLRVFVYGDSTVAGGNGESAPYQVQNLIGQLALRRGLGNIVVTNRGVGGTMVNSLNVLPDLSATTDLVVIKYGINDGGNPEATRLSTFATTLRSKLAEIRAAANGGIGAVSILLVGPNSTSDTPNGRDERWYEQLRGVYVQAARDYQCAYFDTYAYLKDSRGAAGLWMDNPYSDGRAIHPLDAMQTWIWGGVWDAFFGAGETALMSSNTLSNTGAVNGSANVSTLPNDYGYGISIQRATAAAGWPEDGAVITTSQVDGVRIQQLVPYTAGRTRMIMRTADTASNAWNRWTGVVESLTTQNGWVDYGSPGDLAPLGCYLSADGTVYVQGGVKSGTTATGTTVATLPAGMRPAAPAYFPCYTGGATAWVSVNSDGTIRLAGTGNASLMTLNGISFRAA